MGESPGELLNPLEYGQNTYKDMIFRFMFRSPIRGLPNGRGYVGDIANCDLSNLASITCKIQENALWSDGSKMSSQDVLATYEALKNQSVNPKISELIKSFDISGTGQEFTLKSRAGANPLTLDLLTYPIVRSDMVELIKSKRINKTNFISSGPYTYIDSGVDPVFGFDRVTLERSKENGKNVWIEKYIFKFFDDRTQLEKNIDTLHIILPTKDQSSKSIESPRFAEMLYSTYEYIGLFFQSERVVSDLRQSLALSLSNSLS